MTVIHIDAEDWMITAGLIGLTRLLEEERDLITKVGAQLTSRHLDNLADKYINFLLKTFNVVQRDVNRMGWYVNQLKKHPERIKTYAAEVRKMMNEQLKKVEKYYSDTEEYQELLKLVDSIKKVSSTEETSLLAEAVLSYHKIMSTPFITEKLTLNYVKTIILSPFFGQASILQPVFNTKTTHQHIETLNEDFVVPAKLELEFHHLLQQTNDYQSVVSYLEEHQDYKPFKDWLRPIKKMKDIAEIRGFFTQEILPCSFVTGLTATQSYEEKVFSPLALSRNKAVNFNWNFDKSLPVPISAVARLVLLLTPVGLASYTRRIGTDEANETLRFFGLVLSEKNFIENVKDNNTYHTRRMEGSTFEEAIVGLLSESIDKGEKQCNAYFFVELHSEYKSKKTLLDYYHMPAYLASFLTKYGKTLKLMLHPNLRDKFLRVVLKGLDPKQVVFEYLRLAIKEPFHAKGAYHATRARKRILQAGKGVKEMANYDKTITYVYYQGVELRQAIIGTRLSDESGEREAPYRASGRKKIEGIAYRLLNAAKAGNKREFMDTLLRVYMSANASKPKNGKDLMISSVFIEGLKEEGLDFDTIASTFIAGLLGQDEVKKEEGVSHD